jgi:hypothetical protein
LRYASKIPAMNKEDYEMFQKMESWQLLSFFHDIDSSPRRHLAHFILNERFNKPQQEAALSSAQAAHESVLVGKESVKATRDALSAARWPMWAAWASFAAAIVSVIKSFL